MTEVGKYESPAPLVIPDYGMAATYATALGNDLIDAIEIDAEVSHSNDSAQLFGPLLYQSFPYQDVRLNLDESMPFDGPGDRKSHLHVFPLPRLPGSWRVEFSDSSGPGGGTLEKLIVRFFRCL